MPSFMPVYPKDKPFWCEWVNVDHVLKVEFWDYYSGSNQATVTLTNGKYIMGRIGDIREGLPGFGRSKETESVKAPAKLAAATAPSEKPAYRVRSGKTGSARKSGAAPAPEPRPKDEAPADYPF